MIYRFEETGSTNLDARAGAPGDVFVAERQTAGRGRLDHVWRTGDGVNLAFSAVIGVSGADPASVATLPLVVGLAVVRMLGARGVAAAIKWPNDVLVEDRKICGILCERDGDRVIAGIGFNVNETHFPDELADRAVSLAQVLPESAPFDREEVLAALLKSLREAVADWRRGGFAALRGEFAAVDRLRGRVVSVSQRDDDPAPVRGVALGVLEDGSMLVDGKPVYAGEAHVLEC